MPASYTIRRSVPRNTRRSKPASTPSTCFPSFSITCSWRFLSRVVICLPTQQTSYENRKRHQRLVAAMPRCVTDDESKLLAGRAKTARNMALQIKHLRTCSLEGDRLSHFDL